MPTETRPAKRVTAADVARSLGLSRATVGFVLNDTPGQTIPESTRRRVIDEARRMGYRPHQAARALASGQSRIVLLVLPDWPIDYSMRVHLDEASHVLDDAGYSLVTTTMHPGGRARPLWETLSPDVVVGMTPLGAEQLEQVRLSGAPFITPDSPGGAADTFGNLAFADGPRLQVEHLLERGRRRLAFAGSTEPRIADLVAERRALARETLRVSTGEDMVADEDVDALSSAQVVAEWVRRGVDGVVAYNDDVAAMITGAALRAGVEVPGRLAVIGHDDTPLSALFYPALSSVRVDSAGLGRYLAELALHTIAGMDPPQAGPEGTAVLVRRETT